MSSVHQRLEAHAAYSWRADPDVPAFDDSRTLIVFDGVCVFCSRSMRFIAGHDARQSLQFTAAQSTLGQALFRHFALDPTAFETVLVLVDGRALGKRDALVATAQHLTWPWRIGTAARFVPRWLADPLYEALANRRYRLFGRYDACFTPDASWRSRVIE
jgi:predicted DCC family thiol-disulfide oxidoreductase YuxK